MKNGLGILTLLFLIFGMASCSQEYQAFTTLEKELISTTDTTKMRVIQKTNKNDSLILKSKSIPLNPKDPYTKRLAERMIKSAKATSGVGIAATQVGINRRMTVVKRFDKENHPFEVFINPEISWESELMQLGPEGDLSFKDRDSIMRNYIIRVQYQNLMGETISEILEGFTAVIYQHERDHLDGILLIDRAEDQKDFDFKPAESETLLFYKQDSVE